MLIIQCAFSNEIDNFVFQIFAFFLALDFCQSIGNVDGKMLGTLILFCYIVIW